MPLGALHDHAYPSGPEHAAGLARVARLSSEALKVFGDDDSTGYWIYQGCIELGGQIPERLAYKSEEGLRWALAVLAEAAKVVSPTDKVFTWGGRSRARKRTSRR
ncbi:MAG TPA: hypothetical protein VJM11_08535 [Nevskiaceae bacterium]|nr:hypothetical protein [Nevskiaceae bacterium]